MFLVVFDSVSPDETGHAVYIRATADELRDEQSVQAALDCIAARKKEHPKRAAEFLGEHPWRVYQAVPQTVWTNVVNMTDGQFVDERTIIDIESLGPF